jgi:hypothetical protein
VRQIDMPRPKFRSEILVVKDDLAMAENLHGGWKMRARVARMWFCAGGINSWIGVSSSSWALCCFSPQSINGRLTDAGGSERIRS